MQPDPFDPNAWREPPHEHRIYGNKWRWFPTKPCGIARRKLYLRRQIGNRTLYLHVEIMKRIETPPSPLHTIADHKNGDGLDCRRANLRWATPSQNARNIFGSYLQQGELAA